MSISSSSFEASRISKREVLASIEPLVERNMARHVAERKLWMPGELIPASEQMTDAEARELAELPERARGMPDAVRISLALNLLTEEGLPHFHRLLAVYMGSDNAWSRWNFLWTAEEDRHGCVIRDYVRDARLLQMEAFEQLQFQYLEAGFDPEWEHDPYRLLAYTSLQERATQAAHANTGKVASRHEPILQRILGHVAADEARHFRFYRDAFIGVLDIDPSGAMVSALEVMPRLAMPGHTIAGYLDMAEVVHRAGIYGPREYRKVVVECLESWNIAGREPPDAAGREAQEKLLAVPDRLNKLADLVERRAKPKSFSFEFVYGRVLDLH